MVNEVLQTLVFSPRIFKMILRLKIVSRTRYFQVVSRIVVQRFKVIFIYVILQLKDFHEAVGNSRVAHLLDGRIKFRIAKKCSLCANIGCIVMIKHTRKPPTRTGIER